MLMPPDPVTIATITPSGNTVVERTTIAMFATMPTLAPIFSRLAVHGDTDHFPDSYDAAGMSETARLLSHAAPRAMIWNGSKGGAIGLDHDAALVARLQAETGIACDTSGLMLRRMMARNGFARIGLVTPYTGAYVERLTHRFAAEGWTVAAESHLGMTDNLSYASVAYTTIEDQAREVARGGVWARPEILLAWCTNYPAAPLAAGLEEALGLPFWDATALGVLAGLEAAGTTARPGPIWGSILA